MNLKILLSFIVLLASAKMSQGQTSNIFNLTGNGDFEIAGSENIFVTGSSYPYYYQNFSLSRSADVAYSGSYSLKCSSVIQSGFAKVFATTAVTQYQVGKSYIIRAKVYVPSTSGIPVGKPISVSIKKNYDVLNYYESEAYPCYGNQGKVFTVGTDPYDQWVEIFMYIGQFGFTTPENLFCFVVMQNPTGTFYIDKIEMFEAPYTAAPIVVGQTVDYSTGSITLNPSGGLPGWPYIYTWSDGYTGKDRTNLPVGNYTYTVSQSYMCGISPITKTIRFLPPPVVSNPNATVCQGSSIDITPTGLVGSVAWYDSPVGGNLAGTYQGGQMYRFGPFATSGQYFYYADQIASDGSKARSRTKITINVPERPNAVLKSNSIYRGIPIEFTISNPYPGNSYTYYSASLLQTTTNDPSFSWLPPQSGGDYTITVRVSSSDVFGCAFSREYSVNVLAFKPLCSIVLPLTGGGSIKLDKYSGQVIFQRTDNCGPVLEVGCIGGKVDLPLISNVVAASATTYSDNWSTAYTGGPQVTGLNSYERSDKGKWRARSSHTFNNQVNYQLKDRNYEAGRYALSYFNWDRPEVNQRTGWLEVSRVEKYSADGEVVQERNAMNIPSTAKFGYNGSVPYLVAQNAEYGTVYFEGFEKVYGSGATLEEGVSISGGSRTLPGVAHAGSYSLSLTGQFTSVLLSVNDQIRQKGLQVRFWSKGDASSSTLGVVSSAGTAGAVRQVARAGEWILQESIISSIPSGTSQVSVSVNKIAGGSIWIDDVRIQPMDGEMTCYVYDPRTLQLLTVFDDQHFGMYYQYNAEGKLIRKMVETERGVKTIQETQYNTPTVLKSPVPGN